MPDPLVSARGVTRTFGSGTAAVRPVRDTSFEIWAGDHIALVGPSGSGKSTLLHLVAALDRPTSGTIEWPALGPAESLRPERVSFAFQGPSLIPALSVEENVSLPRLLAGTSEEDALREARALLESLGLEAVANHLPDELSGGQTQRAGLARALIGRPRLILADEPTGQLDRRTGAWVVDVLLARAAERGAAVMVATHDPTVADRLGSRWGLENGELRTGVASRSA